MNQLCKVCGEPAAGFHFGAFTCEGCKSFFGRTYNNITAIAACKHNGDCIINKKNRTACKACRLRKCLSVGMSKSGSRYGRRSNWFKIHCLLQEQQSTSSSAGGSSINTNANLDELSRLQSASIQLRQTYQDKTNPSIKSATASSADFTVQASLTVGPNNAPIINLPNFIQAAKYLNEQHHQLKLESRLCNTPSDSGASAAGDPGADRTNLLIDTTKVDNFRRNLQKCSHNCSAVKSKNTNKQGTSSSEEQRRHIELLEIFRTHSESLYSTFAPFNLLGYTPPLPVTTVFQEQLKSDPYSSNAIVDEEPIDLSFRSRTDHNHANPGSMPKRTIIDQCYSASSPCHVESPKYVRKSAPLDLTTLIRSQT